MNTSNTREFARNEKLEALLAEVNHLLAPAEGRVLESYQKPRKPVLLVVGCPRSGTTLLTQWLARSGEFAYPSNLISRFYEAPYVGAKIQMMLTDSRFAFRREMCRVDKDDTGAYESELGKTEGLLAPNEFHYFWRRFFPYGEIQFLSDEELESVDKETFIAELAALEEAQQKPLALKGVFANYNLSFLSTALPTSLFLVVRRQPFFNIQSLILARRKYFDNIEDWYSFKPREYRELKSLSPYHQTVGQVVYTNRSIDAELKGVDRSRVLEIEYEDFCRDPENLWKRLVARFADANIPIDPSYGQPRRFLSANRVSVSPKELERIISACRELFGIEISAAEEVSC